MATIKSFPNNVDEYIGAEYVMKWLHGRTSGVFGADRNLAVMPYENMTVQVTDGVAWITALSGKGSVVWNNYNEENANNLQLTLSRANATYARIDRIVIDMQTTNFTTKPELKILEGAATPNPVAPALIRTDDEYMISIARINVGAAVTQITASDIIDERLDSTVCGIVTEQVSVDTTMMNNQFTQSLADWTNNYNSWFSNVQAQQVTDKASWDAWYATLQEELHNLPSDVAEHLQIEIDEIKRSGTTGSILHITTTNSELEGKTVTVTCGAETRTGTFDSNLECTIVGFKSVGTLTITSTDGIQTAVKTVDIDYYSKYEIAIAFWAATVNIQGDDNLKGTDVVVKDSNNITITTITLNAVTGQGVFEAQRADTYTFNYTVNGTAYSIPLAVTEETTYELSLTAGLDYKQWVTLGGLDPTDYASLSDVFADEAAVRRLMTIHASADYLIEKVTDDIDTIDDFTANDTAMKWIGLRDYVCDGLTVITGVEAKFMASQYWERYLKDHVPVMTSNTAPYGTARASSEYNSDHAAYRVFDNNINTDQAYSNSTKNQWVEYKFTNPICVKKVLFARRRVNDAYVWKICASNDGTNYVDIKTDINTPDRSSEIKFEDPVYLDCNDYYLYWRLQATDDHQGDIRELQFYGRSLDVSVPVMTSNTAPYGEALGDESYNHQFEAFDGVTANSGTWIAKTTSNSFVGYDFGHKVKIKKIWLKNRTHSEGITAITSFKLQGSNDNSNWIDIETFSNNVTTSGGESNYDVSMPKEYRYYGIYIITHVSPTSMATIGELQFYGVDYSEKEFETGSTKKWLYDHGVELETINTTGTATKGDDYITLSAANAQASNTLDLTDYDLLRGKVGDHMSGTTALIAGTTATANMAAANAPNNESLDVSSINASLATGAKMTAAGVCDIKELWLE